MNKQKHFRLTAAAALFVTVAVIVMAFPGTANAQAEETPTPAPGAQLVIFNSTTGPYTVKVIQSPERAVVGTLRVLVEPVNTETGLPVENALVRVFGTPSEQGERQFSPALNSPVDRTLYYAQLELYDAGLWTIDVEIESPLGNGLAIAQTTIHERARSGGMFVGTVLFALISAAFVGAGFWLWYTSKKAREQRNAIRNSGGNPRRSVG